MELRPLHTDATLPANSGGTPGNTITLVTAESGMGIRTFDVVFAIATPPLLTGFTLVEIGVINGATVVTKKFALNANMPTVIYSPPGGLDTGDNLALRARVMANGGGVACQCAVNYARIIPA